jgi:tetratricopeptide (TPR) repeat protein
MSSSATLAGFARRAAAHLAEARVEDALQACCEGTQMFHQYATGFLMMGKCFDVLGRHEEALLAYRRALSVLPDSLTLAGLAHDAEMHARESFDAFAAERGAVLAARKGTITFDTYAAQTAPDQNNTVEFLLKQLQGAGRITPPPPGPSQQNDLSPGASTKGRIVTATLAEIYANQGEYGAAIEAYRRLAEQRPSDAELYARRIQELTELARLSKTGDGG